MRDTLPGRVARSTARSVHSMKTIRNTKWPSWTSSPLPTLASQPAVIDIPNWMPRVARPTPFLLFHLLHANGFSFTSMPVTVCRSSKPS